MMKKVLLFPLVLVVCAFATASAQTETLLAKSQSSSATAQPLAQAAVAAQAHVRVNGPVSAALSASSLGARIEEAKRLLKSRLSAGESMPSDIVTLAVLDETGARIRLLPVEKEQFLKRGAEVLTATTEGEAARVRVVRANGVNTAVEVFDAESGRSLVPLVVEYPILRGGEVREMAYYTSAHPSLLSTEVTTEGGAYVRTMLERAAARLGAEGTMIEPEIVDIAEHLCIVEHTDHKRFMTEARGPLFDEILSLYALNEPDTYRYSVSTAGAGGMVQMIPSTYAMVKGLHPNIRLDADFVGGMTNHSNALSAMLLYMQDTWNDLRRAPEVQEALAVGLATEPELVAAGYNSNPARLPAYLRRGGADWRTLIPAETQMYLSIYGSLDQLHFHNGTAPRPAEPSSGITPLLATLSGIWHATGTTASAPVITELLPAVGKQLLIGDELLSFDVH